MYSSSKKTGKQSSLKRSAFIGARPNAFYPRWDIDAIKYIEALEIAGGQIPLTWKWAINKFYKTIKQYGIWDKIEIFYLFIGGTAACHAINGKNNTAYNITWNGTGIVHNSFGVTGAASGATNYGNTNWNPAVNATVFSLNNASLGCYYQKLVITGGSIGVSNGTGFVGSSSGCYFAYFGTNMYSIINNNQTSGVINPKNIRAGLALGRRISNGSIQGFKNGTQISTHSVGSSLIINLPMYVAAINFNGTASPSANTISFAYVGTGDMNFRVLADSVNKLQTVLGRGVV